MSRIQFIFVTLMNIILGLPLGFANLPPKALPNFNAAKKEVRLIYQEHRQTFFCGLPFDEKGNLSIKVCAKCPSKPVKVQWMHVVQPTLFASKMPCWKEKVCKDKSGHFFKGIQCCRKIDPRFNQFESDLHNIVPEIPFFKSQRQNYSFDDTPPSSSHQSKCHFRVDKSNKTISPDPTIRGMIARTTLYMVDTYHLQLPAKEIALYRKWHQQYPPTDWEKARNNKILKIQGNRNHYLN